MTNDTVFASISLHLPVTLQIVALLVLAGYIIYSVILYYHWQAYATNPTVMRRTLWGYGVSTAPFVLTLLSAAWLV